MTQTLFVLGALSILMVITVNQQRSIFMFQRNAYVREMESVAADLAKQELEQIANSVTFDESRVGNTDFTVDVSDLTLKGSFGTDPGENSADASTFDDLDDYHNFSETITHAVSADTFSFDTTYEVRYVNPSNPGVEPASPSLAKEVIAYVESTNDFGGATVRVMLRKTLLATDYIK